MRKITPLVVLVALLLCPLRSGRADSGGSVVISEVYGGGGNANALYANDYVELHNRTRNPVDLAGWTVGYSPATSTNWSSVVLKGTIAPFHYFLVRLGSGGRPGTAKLPAADVTAGMNVARTAGKVRLAKPNNAGIADLVGFGARANAAEGRPAPAPKDNTHSITRRTCVDTNANQVDFRIRTPLPRNSKMSGNYCGVDPVLAPIGAKKVQANQALTFSVSASDKDGEPLTYSAKPLPAGATFTPSTRTFEWVPTTAQIGDHRVTFKVSDGYRTDSETVTIKVTRDPYAGTSELTLDVETDERRLWASGELKPAHLHAVITVKLFRSERGSWRRVDVQRYQVGEPSTYRVRFRRPQPGRCLITAQFAGDADHPPARAEETVRC